MTRWLPRLWQQPSAVMLAVQLIGVPLYPFMDESPIGRAALSSFALIVLFLAVRPVQATSALLRVAGLLGLPYARSWVMIEQVAGLMYVALVICRIVERTIARQRASTAIGLDGNIPAWGRSPHPESINEVRR